MSKTHTAGFIREMKARLEKEKDQLKQELDQNEQFPEYGRNDEDNATEMADYESSTATKNVVQDRLNSVTGALERIKAGTYGITESGDLIPEDRLRANPAATSTIQ
jgi:RNA polymerase-binding transcription factor DksA